MKIKNLLSEKFLVLLIVINLISFINISLFNIYDSLFFYINLASIISIILLQNRFFKKDIELIMFLLLFLSYGLLTLFITDGGIGSVLTPFYSILVYFVIKRTNIREKSVKFIMWLMIALNLFLYINSKGYYAKWYFNRETYINPNTIGMVIMYTCIYSSIFLRKLKIKKEKIWILTIFFVSILGILNVQSRGSLLALISFILFDTIVLKKIWKSKKFTLNFYIILVVIGVFIPYLYTKLYNSGFQFIIPFTNKPIYTGREAIWNNFYYEIGSNDLSLFFGLGSDADLWSGKSLNLHNNYLAVMANFGVIGFLLYYSFWFFQIKSFFKQRVIENYQVSLLLGFFAILINGFFEISTLWHVMFFLNFMFLGLAFDEK